MIEFKLCQALFCGALMQYMYLPVYDFLSSFWYFAINMIMYWYCKENFDAYHLEIRDMKLT